MTNVLIFGAGSIGNHLAYACRCKRWNVSIADTDHAALLRTREEIFPQRYGHWDESIELISANDLKLSGYDVIIIGTPPDTHFSIARSVFKDNNPKVLLIEKPLCNPDLEVISYFQKLSCSQQTKTVIGYNHIHTENTKLAEKILREHDFGKPLSLTVRWVGHWGGIFSAHPWLNGPEDTYLGFSARGGGACGEHSHGINIWQHFARCLGAGKIMQVSCTMDMVQQGKAEYDRNCLINVVTESGMVGSIAQDVITNPPTKMVRVQGEKGFLEWYAGYKDGKHDAVIWDNGKKREEVLIPRTRPDDFIGEIDEVEAILLGKSSGETISLTVGCETMLVVAAAYRSHQTKQTCFVDYR